MGKATSGTLQSYFEHIHDGTIELAWIFEKIEGKKFTDANITVDPKAEDAFYIRYIIAIVKDCTSDKDCDVLLAIYGFMEGYSGLEIGEQRKMYCQNVGIYSTKRKKDLPLNEHWGNIKSNMSSRERIAVKHLLKELRRKFEETDKTKSYIENAYDLMGKPYPVPNYLSGNGYRKCEVEGKVFYVPLTDEERRIQANIGKQGETSGTSSSLFATVSVRLTEILKKMKILKEYPKTCFRAKDVILFLILFFIAATAWKIEKSLKDSQNPQQHTETADDASATDTDTLMITGITIHNAPITLTPDKPWERLRVSIYPREANIDDLNYISDNIHLVTVSRKKERVEIAPEWRDEREHTTEVCIQSISAEDRISVTVEESSETDNTSVLSESILNGINLENAESIPEF